MKNSYVKWIILTVLLAFPAYGLYMLKDVIFNGGHRDAFPTLCIVPEKDSIPDFSFINQNNDTVTNDYYKDKIYIANFMFTTCPSICPKMTYHMEHLQGKLSRYDNVFYLSHTINPDYDTPEVLYDYAKLYESRYGADLSTWNFVTGDKEELYKMAEFYMVHADKSEKEGDGGFIHSPFFILIDNHGRIRSGFDNYGNPLGVYDGTSASSVKDLIVDVGVLVSEIKRNERKN